MHCFDDAAVINSHFVVKHVVIVGTGIAGLWLLAKAYTTYQKKQRRKNWASAGQDVVILHQIPRGRLTPSISPFPMKLETYLRMTKIPYQNDFDEPMGPKGKTPWMTLNGVDTADSQLCLELLARKFNKNLSSNLSEEEQAAARAIQIMAEEHLYWVLLLWRWVYTKGYTLESIQAGITETFGFKLALPLIRRKLSSTAWGQGMGRHTQDEVFEMGRKDLKALSAYLGTKPFFMGDKGTEVDCAIFGILAQCLWNMPGSPFEHLFEDELRNLKEFCMRMKETYWPDWDRCLLPPRN